VLAALLAVVGFPATLLQSAVDDHAMALAQILPAILRLLAEHDHVDVTHLVLELLALLVPSIDR
jgi:hypothetical protein